MKFVDHATPILLGSPLTQSQQADAWDAFHQAGSPAELAGTLQSLNLPPDTVRALLQAKAQPSIQYSAVDKTLQAIHKLAAMDPQVLSLAESHPHIAKHLADAALIPDEASRQINDRAALQKDK